jgi:hypothetical protein
MPARNVKVWPVVGWAKSIPCQGKPLEGSPTSNRVVGRLAALLALCVLLSWPSPALAQAPKYFPHPPIKIVGDAGFAGPGSGVTGGKGTLEDPYVISGWEIDLDSPLIPFILENGIEVTGTTAYFVIRDCWMHGGGHEMAMPIVLNDSVNGAILDDRFDQVAWGVVATAGSNSLEIGNLTIDGTVPYQNRPEGIPNGILGIDVRDSQGVAVHDVRISGMETGVSFLAVRNGSVQRSAIEAYLGAGVSLSDRVDVPGRDLHDVIRGVSINGSSTIEGILLESIAGVRISRVTIGAGIAYGMMTTASQFWIENSTIEGPGGAGIWVDGGSGWEIRGTYIAGQAQSAIHAWYGHGGVIDRNVIENNRGPQPTGHNFTTIISIVNQPGVNITNNQILNNTGVALLLSGSGSTVEGNVIRGNGPGFGQVGREAGISVWSDRNLVRYNRVNGNLGGGLGFVGGKGNVVEDNDFTGNQGPDIVDAEAASRENHIGQNTHVPDPMATSRNASSPELGLAFLALGLLVVRRRR